MQDLLSSVNTFPGHLVLALFAFCDTLIGVGFLVFGELAFLAAGAAFASDKTIVPAVIVLSFAWAGDLVSYALGRRYGVRFSFRFLARQRRRKAWRKARHALATRGGWFVVGSRLLGPVAWITPFMAGAMEMKPHRFAAASALGVLLGVGQFLIYGALGQRGVDILWPVIKNHLWLIVPLALGTLSAAYLWYQRRSASRS
jgi:membrane protein DedA with SNARE-associated domain